MKKSKSANSTTISIFLPHDHDRDDFGDELGAGDRPSLRSDSAIVVDKSGESVGDYEEPLDDDMIDDTIPLDEMDVSDDSLDLFGRDGH